MSLCFDNLSVSLPLSFCSPCSVHCTQCTVSLSLSFLNLCLFLCPCPLLIFSVSFHLSFCSACPVSLSCVYPCLSPFFAHIHSNPPTVLFCINIVNNLSWLCWFRSFIIRIDKKGENAYEESSYGFHHPYMTKRQNTNAHCGSCRSQTRELCLKICCTTNKRPHILGHHI